MLNPDAEEEGKSIYLLPEFKSDVFKICVTEGHACVTSFTGYSGIGSTDAARRALVQAVQDYQDGEFGPISGPFSFIARGILITQVTSILEAHVSGHMREAMNEIQDVDVTFRQGSFFDIQPNPLDPAKTQTVVKHAPNKPTSTRFNTCMINHTPYLNDNWGTTHFAYATAVHEAGHALGLSNINADPVFYQPYHAAHPTIPDTVLNYDGEAGERFPGLRGRSHREPDCSPHPFDVMAIYALYQNVTSP